MKIFLENKQSLFFIGFLLLIVFILLEILDELKHSNMHTGVLQAAAVANLKQKIKEEQDKEYGRKSGQSESGNGANAGNSENELHVDEREKGNSGPENGTEPKERQRTK